MGVILSIDQGTTGTTAFLIDSKTLTVLGKVNKEFPQVFPKPGWVEHNLNDIWKTVESTVEEVLSKCNIEGKTIDCIGITNQRETICAFDKSSRPICNAIVWQDRRTFDYCQKLNPEFGELVKESTGLPLDPYFSGTKLNWLIENNSEVKKEMAENNCLFGTMDTFLIHKLTNGSGHFTEASNASRTLIFNINTGKWDSKLLDLFNVPLDTLPECKNSFDDFGTTKGLSFLPDGIPITGVLGDQQAALFGQAGFSKGLSKCTYGTGAFYLINTEEELVRSKNGLLSTIAYREDNKDFYAIEGSCYIAGAAVQWLRDQLGIIKESSEIETLSKLASEETMENLIFMPFFTGLGSPYWVGNATASIIGLTRDTGIPQIARACLEGICLSINDLLESIENDTGLKVKELRVDGGAVVNNFLMELQANFSDTKIIRPKVIETTAFGAACAAAIGHGLHSKESIKDMWAEDKSFAPNQSNYFLQKKENWKNLIKRLYL